MFTNQLLNLLKQVFLVSACQTVQYIPAFRTIQNIDRVSLFLEHQQKLRNLTKSLWVIEFHIMHLALCLSLWTILVCYVPRAPCICVVPSLALFFSLSFSLWKRALSYREKGSLRAFSLSLSASSVCERGTQLKRKQKF